ncbi:MAG: hypothetical protein KDC14_06505 [Planctomycetes bacterium]|nr:hypothetical protein [Planctomycetota bacterium]
MYVVLRAIAPESQAEPLRDELAAAAPKHKLQLLRGRMVVLELASSDDGTPWASAAAFLESIEEILTRATAGGCRLLADVDMELNPVEAGPAPQTFVDTVRVPAEALAVLGRLGIELSVSAYREA